MDPTSPDFNPFSQPFTLFLRDGSNVTVPLDLIDQVRTENIKWTTIFGTQIGACSLLLIILAILTKPDKRRAPLFFVNLASIALIIVRSALLIEFVLGPWSNAYRFYTGDYDGIAQSAFHKSIASTIMQMLLNICIMVSLVLQVRVVYASNPKANTIMTLMSTALACVTLGVYLKVVRENIDTILNSTYYQTRTYYISRILFASTICFFTLIFVAKLGMAIWSRRILGLQKFGPLQIIFIMGCQTMIIPGKFLSPLRLLGILSISLYILFNICDFIACFCIAENTEAFDGIASFTAFFVVISLPLSSMWASAQTNTPTLVSMYKPSNTRSFPSKASTLVTSSTLTACDTYRPDLESGSQEFGNHVRIDKSFSVSNASKGRIGPVL